MNKPPQQMNLLCDVVIRAPGGRTPDVQEHHIAIYHTLCAMLEEEFFG
jgi:D-sedoheptulose 7-phosphate isomerase